jgi:hypothetical protein
MRDLVVEATYVGNRGVWWAAPALAQMASNSLTDATLAAYGLSRNNPNDLNLLSSQIGPNAAAAAAHGIYLAYPGMPTNTTVNQQILPVPQWTYPNPWLGPPIGKTWYDSLQLQGTKRYSHGLQLQASFTWSKALLNGAGAETGYYVSGLPVVEDIYNYGTNKQLNQLTRPLATVISGSYTTPKIKADGTGMQVVSQVLRDWQLGAVLRYQSGALIESASSTNQLLAQLSRPQAGFGPGATNLDNYVPGVNRLNVDPNCGCFNPQTTIVLNTNAWANPGAGQWGASAPFYNNYRWQRQPAEAMSFGRNFRMGKEGRYNLQIRAEFQNIFNRLFLSAPTTGSTTTAATVSNGVYTGGYGTIATVNGAGAQPRSGQAVARFTF